MIQGIGSFMSRQRFKLPGMGFLLILAAVFIGPLGSGAQAPSYPTKGITLIYAFASGAAADLFSRAIAPQLSKKFGVPIDIVCKPGGAATIGTLEVMKARKDGYTLLADCPGSSSLQKALGKELPYKIEERTYIVRPMVMPIALFVPAERPWKTLKDVEDAIRKDPANFKWPSFGGTNFPDLTMHLFKTALIARGVDLSQTKTVPFVASTPAYTAVAGGHLDIMSGTSGSIASLLDAGKIRLVAATCKDRTRFFPNLPTCVEQGYNVVNLYWIGYSGPPGLPKNVVETWIKAIREIGNDPANAPIFEKVGGEPAFLAGEEFRKYVFDEAKDVERMVAAK